MRYSDAQRIARHETTLVQPFNPAPGGWEEFSYEQISSP
jgi:hypothetical protein